MSMLHAAKKSTLYSKFALLASESVKNFDTSNAAYFNSGY